MRGASSPRGLRRINRVVVKDSGGMTLVSGIGNVGAPARLEKTLELIRAFLRQNTRGDFAVVVERWHLQEIKGAARTAAARIGTAENDTAHPDMNQGAGAHRARFFRDV